MDQSSFRRGNKEYHGTAGFILAQSVLVNSTDSFLWVATTDASQPAAPQ